MNRIIAALDLPGASEAVEMARRLGPHVAMVKIGLESFVAHGVPLVQAICASGVEVFLDLKLHDIPRTAAAAAAQLAHLNVRLLTVHAAGGPDMVAAVRDALPARTQVIAVTILTSLDDSLCRRIGMAGDVAASSQALGGMARQAGADGLVCSAHELQFLASLGGSRIVPGVRPAGMATQDQKRVATPQEAVVAGATWIVLGRPLLQASDPVAMARDINAQLAQA